MLVIKKSCRFLLTYMIFLVIIFVLCYNFFRNVVGVNNMREEILNSIKRDYQSLKEKQKEDNQIMARYLELEKNDLVQEYLQLKSRVQVSKYKLSDDDLLDISYRGNSFYVDQTNEIYVCLGEVLMSGKDVYKRYVNLEDERDSVLVADYEADLFEVNHKIVYLNDDNVSCSKKFHDVQLDFLRTSIDYDQEKAISKVLKKRY